MNGMYVMSPFLTIHTLAELKRPESYMGYLVAAQMLGGIIGNGLAGYLGDRNGGKVPMILSRFALIFACLWVWVAKSEWEFLTIFMLFGFAFYSDQVGTTTLCIEISPLKRRATYLAIMSTLTMPSMLVASAVSSWVWTATETFSFLAAITAATMAVSLYYLARIDEPREA